MTRSMTGFATARGSSGDWSWVWDLRSVNGRGLDLRLRLPDWIEGLEQAARQALQAAVSRGNVTLSLRISRAAEAGTAMLDRAALVRTVSVLREIEDLAAEHDLAVRHATAAEIAALPGVLSAPSDEADTAALRGELLADLPGLLAAFDAARAAEGAALGQVIGAPRRAGTGPSGGEIRCDRGTRPPARPCGGGARASGRRRGPWGASSTS
jgi:uncharacterized protein (TIGR00255 family)